VKRSGSHPSRTSAFCLRPVVPKPLRVVAQPGGRRLPDVATDDARRSGADPRDTGNPWTTRIWLRRGDWLEFDRLAFFSDAVFAIAITLVAVEIGVPEVDDATSPGQLWAAVVQDLPTVVAFFITFAILASYWLVNHRFLSTLRGLTPSFRLGVVVYLATIAFLPYPASTFGRYPDNAVAVALLAVAASAVSAMEAVLFWSAFRADLFAQPVPRSKARRAMAASLAPVAVFLVSIPVAFGVHPLAGVAVWFLGPVVGIVQDLRHTGL
jgi:uncharacterized membrane protein